MEAVLKRRLTSGGEPQYLVKWLGYTAQQNSWEPWTSLIGTCASMIRDLHRAEFASGLLPSPLFAAGCPASHDLDTELRGWRIGSRRTDAGRKYTTYYGPLGEHVRSRTAALQLAALYELPKAWGL